MVKVKNMLFGFRKKKEYKVIKIYQIIDVLQAESFLFKNFILDVLSYTKELNELEYDGFEINFGAKTWKTEKGFKSGISKFKDSDIFYFKAVDKNDDVLITFENPILNLQNQPKNGILKFEISLNINLYEYDLLISFLKRKYDSFSFDYGYIVDLDDTYNHSTETKIKKGLFSQEIATNEIDYIWRFHCIGVNYGYLKSIYSFNFLNNSHLNSTAIKDIIRDGIGTFEPINEKITLWSLDDSDMQIATERCIKAGNLIAEENSFSDFLNTEDAKKFKGLMKSD